MRKLSGRTMGICSHPIEARRREPPGRSVAWRRLEGLVSSVSHAARAARVPVSLPLESCMQWQRSQPQTLDRRRSRTAR
ncbi:hypothetical protein CGRA01v4_12569 [Colletotrichum graminicola]|nr:hypothetical protein CGRA01v4_12569 [Colletotrichum graminicola]